jgi:hypothetical protein
MDEQTGSWTAYLWAILPIIIGWITLYVMRYVKKASTWVNERFPVWIARFVNIDGFPAIAQRILVLLIAAALTYIGDFIGVRIPTDLAAIQGTDVSAVLSAIISFLTALVLHAGDKATTSTGS